MKSRRLLNKRFFLGAALCLVVSMLAFGWVGETIKAASAKGSREGGVLRVRYSHNPTILGEPVMEKKYIKPVNDYSPEIGQTKYQADFAFG